MPQNRPRDEAYLLRKIAELQKRVEALETSPRSGNSSVSHGKFVIKDGETGAELHRVGYLGLVGGNEVRGTRINRVTGEMVLSTWTDGQTGGFWALYDLAQNQVVSDDAVSGQGLARPYIGGPQFAPSDTTKWPTVTSSSYTNQFTGMWWKQHPRLHVVVQTITDSTTSGDIQVTCNGVSVSQHVNASDGTVRDFYLTVPGPHESYQLIYVATRRTGGTGFLGCYPMGAYGIQS